MLSWMDTAGGCPGDASADLPAGDFSAWLAQIGGALRAEHGSDVPCGGCTACCTSSQFVHIGPDESDTLARIPSDLLFPAPRMPPGHVLLGYDDRGHCPMLVDGRCSIYEHRPRTCRTYDCRVFPAAGIEADQDLVAERARRWRFDHPTGTDLDQHRAVRVAAAFLARDPGLLPDEVRPRTATQLAVLAVEIHELFLEEDEPDGEAVRERILRIPGG